MVVMLDDLQICVKHKPMDEVGELAHAASNILGCGSGFNGQSYFVSSFRSASTHKIPKGESLIRTNQDSIDMRCS